MPLPLRTLHIIDQPEIVFPREPKVQCCAVGNTHELDRIVEDPAFDILIGDAIDVDLTIHSFEISGIVVIGKFRGGQLNGDQLVFIIMPEIKLGLHLPVRLILHEIIQDPVTEPVE